MSGIEREVARLLVQLEAEVNGLKRGLREGDRAWASHVQDVKRHLDRIASLEDQHNRTREITKKNSLARQIADEKTALARMHQAAVEAASKRDALEAKAAADRKAHVRQEMEYRKNQWAQASRYQSYLDQKDSANRRALASQRVAAERQAAKAQVEAAREVARAQRESSKQQQSYLRQTERAQERLRSRLISVERAAVTWARRGATIAATATGLIGLRAVKTAGQFEQTEVAFEHMMGSGVKAKTFLDKLKEFAATTPFEFSELTDQAKRLMAVGFAAKDVLPTLTTVGDAVASLGLDNSRLNRVILALSQMRNAASISAQDMRQLTEAGMPVWDMLTKGLNERGIKAKKSDVVDPYWRKDQKLSGADGFAIVMEQMNKRYKGMMKKQSATLLGLWSNFKDRLTYLMIDVGNMIIERFDLKDRLAKMVQQMRTGELQAKIMGVVESVVDATEAVIEFGTWLWKHKDAIVNVAEAYVLLHVQLRAMMIFGSITGALRAYNTAAATSAVVTGALGTSMAGTTGKAAKGMTGLRGAMMAVPFGPWGLAAIAAGTGAYYLAKHVRGGSDAYKKITPEAQAAADVIESQRKAAENAKNANQKLKDANKAVADAAEKAGKKSDAYKDALKRQEQAAKDAKKANDDLKTSQDTDGDGVSGGTGDKGQDTYNGTVSNAELTRLIEERKAKFRELQKWMEEYNAKTNYKATTGAQLGLQGQPRAIELPGGASSDNARIKQLQEMKLLIASMYEGKTGDPVAVKEMQYNLKSIEGMIDRIKSKRKGLGDKIAGRWDELDENKKVLDDLYRQLGITAPWDKMKVNSFNALTFLGQQVIKTTPIVRRELTKMMGAEGIPSGASAGVVKKMLQNMDAATLQAKFGTDNVNKILARAGLISPNPKWKNEFAESNRRAVENARKEKERANAQLAAVGKINANTSQWGTSLIAGIQNAIGSAKAWATKNPVTIGIKALLSMAGIGGDDSFGAGGSTKGLKPQMLNPLGIGQRMGLSMSSGLRPGAVTKNGKRSDHATGNAIDMVGTKTQMAAYYGLVGSLPGLKQRIYSPLDGWSNDHYDHVHVAMRRNGGYIPGSSHQDTVPAMLTKGEYIFTREAVQNAGGPGAMDYFHNRLKGGGIGDAHGSGCGCVSCGVSKFRKGGAVAKKKTPPKKPKVGNVSGAKKPVKAGTTAGYITGAANADANSEKVLIAQREAQRKLLAGLQDDENKAAARVNKENSEFNKVKAKYKPKDKQYKTASKQYKDALKDLKKIQDRRRDAAGSISQINKDIISGRQQAEQDRQEALADTIEQETGKRNFEYSKALSASDMVFSNLSVKEGDARRTGDTADDIQVAAEMKSAWQAREAEVRKYLGKTDITQEEREGANSELRSIMDALYDIDSGANNDADTQAQIDKLKKSEDDYKAKYIRSQQEIGVLSGAGDLGYAGGANAWESANGAQPQTVYNINALSGNDPAIQRAMASASNGGNSQGGNADILYSGRK